MMVSCYLTKLLFMLKIRKNNFHHFSQCSRSVIKMLKRAIIIAIWLQKMAIGRIFSPFFKICFEINGNSSIWRDKAYISYTRPLYVAQVVVIYYSEYPKSKNKIRLSKNCVENSCKNHYFCKWHRFCIILLEK